MDFRKTQKACYSGYITQAVTVNLAPLLFVSFQRSFGVSLGFLATLTLVTFATQIAVDLAAARFMERLSYRALCVLSQVLSAAGLICLSFLPFAVKEEIGLVISAVLYSAGSALSEVVLSPLMEALPREADKATPLVLLHSFHSWGHVVVILLTTAIFGLFGDELWFVVPVAWALVPLYNIKKFSRVPMPEMTCHDENSSGSKLFESRLFVLAILVMISSGAAEHIMTQWSSFYAEMGLGISKTMGDLLGPCVFAFMMAAGRTAWSIWGKRMDLCKILFVSSALTVVCFALAVAAKLPIVSLLACGMSGLGVSLIWPGIMSVTKEKHPGAGASMFALLAVGGDIGCSVGPFVVGSVSELAGNADSSLRMGLLVGTAFPIILTACIFLLMKSLKK